MFRLHAHSTVIEKCNLYNNMYVHKVSKIGSAVSKLHGAITQKMTNVAKSRSYIFVYFLWFVDTNILWL